MSTLFKVLRFKLLNSSILLNQSISNSLTSSSSFLRCYYSLKYKSDISIDKLFKMPSLDSLSKSLKYSAVNDNSEEFSGFIPIDKLQITYKTSSKPGGQHANRTHTGVEVRFHVDSAKWIPESIRSKFKEKNANKLTKEGYFIVKSEKTRKTILNQADCIEQLRSELYECTKKPRELTQEEILKAEIKQKIADGRRLIDKRKSSSIRSYRRHPVYDAKFDHYEKM